MSWSERNTMMFDAEDRERRGKCEREKRVSFTIYKSQLEKEIGKGNRNGMRGKKRTNWTKT